MADETLKIDENNKPVVGFVTDDSDEFIKMGRIDDATKGLKVMIVGGTGGGGITWNNVTGTTQSATVNNGYIANNVALVTITLPSTAAVGSIIAVAGNGAGGWLLAQNAGQIVNFGAFPTTTGAAGSLASINRYDCVEVVCTVANTTWVVKSSVGNLTVT